VLFHLIIEIDAGHLDLNVTMLIDEQIGKLFHLTVEIDVGLPPVVGVDGGLEQPLAAGQPQPVVEECGPKERQGLELCPGKEDLSSHGHRLDSSCCLFIC
jgi:hypothetical protein